MTTDRRAAVPADERIKGIAKRVSPNWIGGSPVPREDVEFLLSELAAERSRRLQAEQERDEARDLLATAAQRINCAGPVHHRIDVLRRELTEWGEAAERERDALQAKLDALPILATVQRNAELEAQIQKLRESVRRCVTTWRASASWEHQEMGNTQFAQGLDVCADEIEAALAAVEGHPQQAQEK